MILFWIAVGLVALVVVFKVLPAAVSTSADVFFSGYLSLIWAFVALVAVALAVLLLKGG